MLKRTLLHSGWSFACSRWLAPPQRLGHGVLDWLPAQVPGHVHLDLVRHGIIAEPLAVMGELGCQWVDEEDWSYRTEFEFRPDASLPRRVLCFEGLDTVATVTLNAEAIASHDNMFVPLEIDVSTLLSRGSNELRVDFASATRVGLERRARYLEREGLPARVTRFDERAFVRKAQYMFGWDWGPRLVSAGIWRPVSLVEHAGRLRGVHADQRRSGGSFELRLVSEVDGQGEVVHQVEGTDRLVPDGAWVPLQAERWWPSGLGPQRRYTVTSWLVPVGTPPAELEARALDRRVTRVGFRELELVRVPDRFGESFEFTVNGRRLWVVGANWVPEHSFPSLATGSRLRERLEQASKLGCNMLRVWGGGLYESEAFYDLCDELGLLVWQDFGYACSYYPDDETACDVAHGEALELVRRLRNHPSLALYCGNNENSTMFHDRWGPIDAQPPRLYGERIYDGVLRDVTAAIDASRPYVPSSPLGGANPNDGGSGDQHCWDVWHGRGDWRFYEESRARFASEFGFASSPGHRAWRRALGEGADLALVRPEDVHVRWHDKTGKDYARFSGLVELHYPASANLDDWVYYSQLNQRDALRQALEHYRRSRSCRGALVWQLNDCWPVQSWALIDAAGRYKAAAYEIRRLFAPLLLAIELAGAKARVWTILDNLGEELAGELSLEAHGLLDGRLLERWSADTRVRPDERRVALEIDIGAFDPTETILSASFLGRSAWRLLSEPKDARLTRPRLSACIEDGSIVIGSDVPLVDLVLWDEPDGLVFEENLITLPAPGQGHARFTGPPPACLRARSLAGSHRIEVAAPQTDERAADPRRS